MAQAQKDIAKSVTSALDLEQQLQISYAQKGVCVLDVYSAEWGACKAISETFRRLNNDAGDAIHLRFFTVECNAVLDSLKSEDPAAARHQRPKNVDAIRETLPEFWQPLLEARRGKSKPYFLLYKDGKKMYEVDGVNTPQIRAFVKDLCTVKTPAHEFISNPKALEFWESHFNADESEVGVEKFMRALTAVCALQVALTDDERVALYEALGTSKDAREKIITAEAVQRWVGDDEGRSVAQAFHDTLPEYEARAKQVRAARDAEEKKRLKEEADAKAIHDKKDAEERAAAERVQQAADNMEAAVAAEEARNPIPTREELDAMAPADAVARLDDDVEHLLSDAHIRSAKEGDVSRKLARGMRAAMESAWSSAAMTLRPVNLLPSTTAAEPVLFDLVKALKKSHSMLKELGAFVPTPTLTVAVHKARENPIARGCGAHLAALAVTLVTSTAEQNAASIGAAQTAETIADLDYAAVINGKPLSKPNMLSMLLFAVADNDEVAGPFFALLNAADLPEEGDLKKDVVLPLLAPMSTVPVEAPEGTVLVKIVGIDRVVRVSETVVLSAGMHVGSIGALDGGRPTFAADMPMGTDLLPELAAKFLTRLKEDERRLIALDKIAQLRELRRDYAKRVPDPFWASFDAKFPLEPPTATRAVFESIDTTKNGTLGLNEVIKAMRQSLAIPAGDDIAPVVKSSFEAVKAAPMKGVKKAKSADAISYGEFVALVRYMRSYFGIWRVFAQFQNKSSQQMTKADVLAAAPALARLSPAVDMSDAIFDELDTDKSGVVTFAEFARWALNKNLDIMMAPEKDILNTSDRIDDDEDEAPSSPPQAASHPASAPAAGSASASAAAAAAPAHHDSPKAPTPAPSASAADAAVAKSASNAAAGEPPAAKTPTPPPSSSHAAVAEAPVAKAPTPAPEEPAKAPTPVQEPVQAPTPAPEEPAKAPTPAPEEPAKAPTPAPEEPVKAATPVEEEPVKAPTPVQEL